MVVYWPIQLKNLKYCINIYSKDGRCECILIYIYLWMGGLSDVDYHASKRVYWSHTRLLRRVAVYFRHENNKQPNKTYNIALLMFSGCHWHFSRKWRWGTDGWWWRQRGTDGGVYNNLLRAPYPHLSHSHRWSIIIPSSASLASLV